MADRKDNVYSINKAWLVSFVLQLTLGDDEISRTNSIVKNEFNCNELRKDSPADI